MSEWLIPVILMTTLGIILLFYFAPSYTPRLNMIAGPFDLSKTTTVVNATDAAPLLNPDFSFQAFLYLNPLMRTGTHVECGTDQNKPSCSDGVFQPCICKTSGDCGTCAHSGYYSVVNLYGIATLEIMPVPDASRQGAVAAQLIIKTEMMTDGAMAQHKYYIETIPLPAMTVQKWTMVTISKEGRRFDIYYNKELIASKKTMYMPISNKIDSNLTGIVSGSSGLIGQMASVTLNPSRTTILDVEKAYSTRADTRGAPYLNGITLSTPVSPTPTLDGIMPTFAYSFGFKLPTFSFCLSGDCGAPAVKPGEWTNTYG